MRPSAFEKPGRFFKGNLHTHSNRSDGALPPDEVCKRYREAGYDFLALTDHFVGRYDYPIVDTRDFQTEAFTTLPGAELHSGAMENGELWHILAVGLPYDFMQPNAEDFLPVPGQETGPEIAQRARDAGAFVAIAHPDWSGLTEVDARSLEAAHAVEVYNHTCSLNADRAFGFHTLERLLTEGRRLSLCATDDAHFHVDDAFGGWVMVKAADKRPADLLQSLKDGDFYSSQGPHLHDIQIDDGHVLVHSSKVNTVIVQGQGTATNKVHGEGLSEARVKLTKCLPSPWLRVTVIDADGKRAWSQPIWRADHPEMNWQN
ncbi:MAG: CehA/McbA family metallohydrolase [Pseudomonadota bacterium]